MDINEKENEIIKGSEKGRGREKKETKAAVLVCTNTQLMLSMME